MSQFSRLPSDVSTNAPFRVPTNTRTLLIHSLLSEFSTRAAVPKLGQRGRGIPSLPSPPDFGQKFTAVVLDLPDHCRRRAGFLVARSPKQQLQKQRRQVDAFFRKAVIDSSSIPLFDARGDDFVLLQFLQTIRKDVCGNPLAALAKFLKCPARADH